MLCFVFCCLLYFNQLIVEGVVPNTNQLKLKQSLSQKIKKQQQSNIENDSSLLFKQIFSYLTDDELSLLYNSTNKSCIYMENMHDIETWKELYKTTPSLRNLFDSKQSIVKEECEEMDLAPACFEDCIYYNNVLGWIGALINDLNMTEEIFNMVQLYSVSAGPMAFFDSGNPDMCNYYYGTYCYTPAMATFWGDTAIIMQHACCVPGTCIGDDAINVLRSNGWCYSVYSAIYNNLTVEDDYYNSGNTTVWVANICEPLARNLDDFGPNFVIAVFCIFVLLVIIASCMKQYFIEYKHDEPEAINKTNLFIASFNINDILKSFSSIRPSGKREYNFLDGIRVWSMSWVILGHSIIYFMTDSSNAAILMPFEGTRTDYKYVVNEFYMVFAQYAMYSVDSFFFLSSFLAAFSIWRQIKKYSTKKAIKSCYLWIPLSYLSRILRIVPMMMYTTAIQWQLQDQLSGGYHVISRDQYTKYCDNNWYKVLFFYANIGVTGIDFDGMTCMGHLWYIQCDMQMFLLLPWILLCFSINKVFGLISAIIPIIICIIIRIYYGFYYHFYANMLIPPYQSKYGKMMDTDSYVQPWTRMSVYFIGVATLFIFVMINEKYKKYQLTKKMYFILMLLSGFILLSLMCWPYNDVKDAPTNRWGYTSNSMYYALSRPAWGFGLAFLSFAIRYRPTKNGEKSIIASFLSLEIYQPLGKLTYLMYLLHLIVYQWWVLDLEVPIYYTIWDESLIFFAGYAITLCLSIILWIFMEKPVSNLTNLFLKWIKNGFSSSNNKKNNIDDHTSYDNGLNKKLSHNQQYSIDGANNDNYTIFENEQTLKEHSMMDSYK